MAVVFVIISAHGPLTGLGRVFRKGGVGWEGQISDRFSQADGLA